MYAWRRRFAEAAIAVETMTYSLASCQRQNGLNENPKELRVSRTASGCVGPEMM